MQPIFIINPTAGKLDASVALIPQIHAAASRAGVRRKQIVVEEETDAVMLFCLERQ